MPLTLAMPENVVFGNFVISSDLLETLIAPKLDAESLIIFSMTGKYFRNLVDRACSSIFVSEINRQMYQRALLFSDFLDVEKDDTQENKTIFKACVQVETLYQKLQTLRFFHAIDKLRIPVALQAYHNYEQYVFSKFEILKAYMPDQGKQSLKHVTNVRKYNFKLKSVLAQKQTGDFRRRRLETLPDVELHLTIKNALVCQNPTPRQYYVNKCKRICLMCNRNTGFYTTYQEVSEKRRERICKICRREFCVTLSELYSYGMRFNVSRAKDDVKEIEISYVPECGAAGKRIKFMFKDDLAKFAGFSDWRTMVLKWPRGDFTRHLKKNSIPRSIQKKKRAVRTR